MMAYGAQKPPNAPGLRSRFNDLISTLICGSEPVLLTVSRTRPFDTL
jgi:hypothetical protein